MVDNDRIVSRDFYLQNDVVGVAKNLLGKVLITNINGELTSGIILETEAYAGTNDRASHAFGSLRTERTEVMFQEGGRSYVYLCYGIHRLFNIVIGDVGDPLAVLIRNIIPFQGIDIMKARRNHPKNKKWMSGPGTLSQAMGIQLSHNNISLGTGIVWLEDQGISIEEKQIETTPRIGVDYAGNDAKLPYRFLLTDFQLESSS